MLKTMVRIGVGLLLVAMIVVASRNLFRDGHNLGEHAVATRSSEHVAPSAGRLSVEPDRLAPSSVDVKATSPDAIPGAHPVSDGNEVIEPVSVSAPEQIETKDLTPSAENEVGPHVERSARVTGAFHTSPSIEANCARNSRPGDDFCQKEHKLLASFASELREPVWASQMEDQLRRIVASEGNKFTLRGVECRASLCILEVASSFGPYLGIGYEAEVQNKLSSTTAVFAYEKADPGVPGVPITVTLKFFERD